jgi:hypothetical protein
MQFNKALLEACQLIDTNATHHMYTVRNEAIWLVYPPFDMVTNTFFFFLRKYFVIDESV